MNPDQIALVQSSFEKVRPIADQAAALFYGRLFELSPEVRPLFKADLQDQGKKLMQMIGVAVAGLDQLDAIVPAVQNLGRNHVSYGVKAEHYPAVGEALLWTLEQGLGDNWNEELGEAWTQAYSILSNTMQDAAAA